MDNQSLYCKDLCMECGRLYPQGVWGNKCRCKGQYKLATNAVHLMECSTKDCFNMLGQLTDDIYSEPELIYCHECVNKALKKGNNNDG